ncbi:1-acyl-sn-glycerol-3-phosphate acyltransferase [Chitinimonas sp. BJYL2]|uniref:lysophospholipid acyltransferase family protein n=1 Tax=Chitinimonas sp. BJYL2 TaxID=2976696 RepID=UPI0022B2EBFD|nr:lysophospholipid acyltransferase family protein [Chitinimonas sp. BJYL2]
MITSTPRLLRLWRLARLLFHFARGIAEVGLIFKHRPQEAQEATVRRWSRKLCDILSIHIEVVGTPPVAHVGRTMVVANHVSWLDIFVLNAVVASRFVAKSEVRAWPLLGWLCHHSGTLFVQRERRHDTRRVNQEISDALVGLDLVSVFPEGGTTDGLDVARFNASLLQPAIDVEAKLAPAALCYLTADGHRTIAAAYVGEMSLLDSIRQILAEPHITARVHYLPILPSKGLQRRELAAAAHHEIRQIVHKPLQDHHSQDVTRACRDAT